MALAKNMAAKYKSKITEEEARKVRHFLSLKNNKFACCLDIRRKFGQRAQNEARACPLPLGGRLEHGQQELVGLAEVEKLTAIHTAQRTRQRASTALTEVRLRLDARESRGGDQAAPTQALARRRSEASQSVANAQKTASPLLLGHL